jgi:hypothetical protein
MPVLVHAAHRPLARALTHRLLREGGQVRATANAGVAALRSSGVFTAVCDPDDEGTLEAALTQVHTFVVMLGGLGRPDVDGVRREGLIAARAAEGADVQRVILVTLAGSGDPGAEPLRRAHGAVAAAFADLPVPSIEIRTGLVDTPATVDLLLGAGLPAELRARTVAPVAASALLELVVAVDRARGRASEGHLVVSATGTTSSTLEQHLERSSADRRGSAGDARRLTGRRVPSPAARESLLAALDGPWDEKDPLVPDGWRLFGVDPTVEVDRP